MIEIKRSRLKCKLILGYKSQLDFGQVDKPPAIR